jgi:N-acetylglucosaminyldiphosphoundecaprenol N-acetyl-beta-D-mannosaminyltransferase
MSAAAGFQAVQDSMAIRPPESVRVSIGRCMVDSCSFEQAQSAILAHAYARGEAAYVITPNAQHIVLLNKDAKLREIYRNANLVLADGISLVFAARIFGHDLPERVTGVDLFQSLCAGAAKSKLKVFFLGGRPNSAELCAAHLRERHPGLDVETYCPPMGFENDPAELENIAAKIRNSDARILFAGLGTPKQEYWIYEHGIRSGASVCIGIGGSFEMVSGVVKRAPQWIQALACEWLYRLCVEPRRMWRRYLVGNSQFISIILNQRVTRLIFSSLVRMLYSSGFNVESQDPHVCAKAIEVLSRTPASESE